MNSQPLTLCAPGAQLCAGLLGQGLTVRVRVSGASMAPVLVNGDVVHLAPVKSNRLRTGDIVFIQDPRQGYYLHRLLRRPWIDGQAMIQTRGDSHWRLDDAVSSQQVLARVTDIEHRPGKPRHWRWLAATSRMLAGFQLLQSACYYLFARFFPFIKRSLSIGHGRGKTVVLPDKTVSSMDAATEPPGMGSRRVL